MRVGIRAVFVACLCATPSAAQAPCTGDLNADRVVDGNDLGLLLAGWGNPGATDLNADGVTDGNDLGLLLAAWGACPIVTPSWATLVEAIPDPAVVTDAAFRQRIAATGWAWRVRHSATQIEMLLVPRGTYLMGCSPASSPPGCNGNEEPVHSVELTAAFYLGRFEVTQAQWVAQMGSNPSRFRPDNGSPGSMNRPVEQVSWSLAHTFVTQLAMRLPTEAEWEYACRAGTLSAFNNGSSEDSTLSQVAWFGFTNPTAGPRPVGLKAPNRLGFHDMHGNVFEWVNDWYGENYYASSPSQDPPGPPSGPGRANRGGSWNMVKPFFLRSSFRNYVPPNGAQDNLGFRVARNP